MGFDFRPCLLLLAPSTIVDNKLNACYILVSMVQLGFQIKGLHALDIDQLSTCVFLINPFWIQNIHIGLDCAN